MNKVANTTVHKPDTKLNSFDGLVYLILIMIISEQLYLSPFYS